MLDDTHLCHRIDPDSPAITPAGDRRCPWCGDPEVLEIADIWSGHEFMLETCCFARHEQVMAEMADDPAWATELLRQLGAEVLTGHRLRRLYDDRCSSPVLDFRLDVRPVAFAAMRDFVRRHHRHCPPPVAWRFGASIWNGWTRVGVVSVGNPVAVAYMNRGWVEVNRLCIRHDLAPQLAWNACSQLYGHAAREAERRGFNKIITYIREEEDGTSLKAAGWTCEGAARGRGWHSVRRARSNENAWITKERWSRELHPKPAAGARLKPTAQPPNAWFAASRKAECAFALECAKPKAGKQEKAIGR